MNDAFWGVVLFLGLGVISGIGYFSVAGSYPTMPILPFLALPLLSFFVVPARALGRMLTVLFAFGMMALLVWAFPPVIVPIMIFGIGAIGVWVVQSNILAARITGWAILVSFSGLIAIFALWSPFGPTNSTFTKINTQLGNHAVSRETVHETLEQRVRRENDFRDAVQADIQARREAQAREATAVRPLPSKPQEVIQILPPGGFPTPSFPTATFDAPSSRMPPSAQRAIDSATAKFDARALENSGRFLAAVEASEKHPLHSRLTECRMRIRDPGIVAGREGVQARQQLIDCLSGQR